MSFGKPSIANPRAFDLRTFQGSVAAIRQRIEMLEQAATALQNAGGSSVSASAFTQMQIALSTLASRVAVLEAQVGNSDTLQISAVDDFTVGDPVVAVQNGAGLADPNNPLACFALLGLARTAAAAGGTLTVQRRGSFAVPGAVFEIGRAVYATYNGLTQFPSYEAAALPVGVAIGTSTMWIAPGYPALRTLGFDDGYEDFMPASVGLMADALAFMTSFNALPDGILVKVGDSQVTTRTLREGENIAINYPDGVASDPVISYEPSGAVRPLAGRVTITGFAPTVVRTG